MVMKKPAKIITKKPVVNQNFRILPEVVKKPVVNQKSKFRGLEPVVKKQK